MANDILERPEPAIVVEPAFHPCKETAKWRRAVFFVG